MDIEYFETNTWKEFREYIDSTFIHFTDYIFRGHRQDDQLLESTIDRLFKKINMKPPYDVNKMVISHLEKFKRAIRSRRGTNPSPLDNDQIWALGQHFGLATPLLDWTSSPYVGMFFAFNESEKSKPGKRALWAISQL